MSYATEGVKPDVRELGVSRLCNRQHRLVVTLLGFFGEESHIICGLQRKEISSGGKYSLLTRVSESCGWTVDDRDRESTASNWLTSNRKARICLEYNGTRGEVVTFVGTTRKSHRCGLWL